MGKLRDRVDQMYRESSHSWGPDPLDSRIGILAYITSDLIDNLQSQLDQLKAGQHTTVPATKDSLSAVDQHIHRTVKEYTGVPIPPLSPSDRKGMGTGPAAASLECAHEQIVEQAWLGDKGNCLKCGALMSRVWIVVPAAQTTPSTSVRPG